MPDNGINFEQRFGKPADKMDEGEWRMALVSLLSELCIKVKPVPKMEKMFYVIVYIAPFLLGGLGWWFIQWLEHLAGH